VGSNEDFPKTPNRFMDFNPLLTVKIKSDRVFENYRFFEKIYLVYFRENLWAKPFLYLDLYIEKPGKYFH